MEPEIDERKTVMLVGDERKTLVLAGQQSGSPCRTCRSRLARGALYCGMCGQRVRQRDSLTGTVIDELYEIHEKLAEGGFAAVYRARYIPSGYEVALKVLHADLAEDSRVVTRFRREARSLLRLRSRHTVSTYDFGETENGTRYIVMELLHGESLQERLRIIGPLPWRETLRIMHAVCASLSEAHAHGIVHRDLKPSNIHIGNDDVVKLIDFGLAKVYGGEDEDLTRAGQTVGTLQYMPPEQLVGTACDARTDIYALGVVAYEMLTGQRPFADAITADRLVSALLTQSPALASSLRSRREVPQDVDDLVARCLERDMSARFATVRELAAAIERILAAPIATPRRAQVFPHTPQFEVALRDSGSIPEFLVDVHGTNPEIPPTKMPRPLFAWLLWAVLFIVGGVGVGTAVARLV